MIWATESIKFVDNHFFNINETPYVVDVFQDESPSVVVRKSSQTRISMTMILRFLHRVAKLGLNGIYYFPTDAAMYPFEKGRIKPLIDKNERLSQLVRSTDSTQVKQIGMAFAYFLGLKGKTQKESITADHLVFDEFDLMAPNDVEIGEQRVEASEYKYIDYIGNPTIPDYGIDWKFQQSDQKFWGMKCPHCSMWNIFLGEEKPKFDPAWIEQGFLACQKCRKDLDSRVGAWIPRISDYKGQYSGYQVTRLFAKNVDYPRILRQYRTNLNRANFFNRVLGLPWSDKSSKIEKEHVLKMCDPSIGMATKGEETTAGIDVNPVAGHHMVVSRPSKHKIREIIWMGILESMEEVDAKLGQFGVEKFVIDAQPDLEGARKLCQRHRSAGWLCYYSDTQKDSANWDEDHKKVTVNRTESMDSSQRLLRDLSLVLPRRSPLVEVFAEHAANTARVIETNEENGQQTARYVQLGSDRPDHFRHAFNYDVLAGGYGDVQAMEAEGVVILPDDMEDAPSTIRDSGRW